MKNYRAYVLGESGSFVKTVSIEDTSDRGAAAQARLMLPGQSVEIWDGARFVARVGEDSDVLGEDELLAAAEGADDTANAAVETIAAEPSVETPMHANTENDAGFQRAVDEVAPVRPIGRRFDATEFVITPTPANQPLCPDCGLPLMTLPSRENQEDRVAGEEKLECFVCGVRR